MAELLWNSNSKTVFVKVDSAAGYGQDYEIIGSLGSKKTGTTSSGGLNTNTNWRPSYNNETLTLYINNAYKGQGCYTGSAINWGSSCSGSGGGGDSGGDEDAFQKPSISSFGASTGTYNNGELSFNMAIRINNPNDYDISGSVQITPKNNMETHTWSSDSIGGIPSGNTVVTRSFPITETIGTYSPGTHTIAVNFYYSFYWINEDTGRTQQITGQSSSVNVTFTVANNYPTWTWADGSSGVNAIVSGKSNFTDKITAGTWLTIIAAVNKLKGTNISTSGVQSGQKFTATHYNNVASALGLSTVSSGQDCDASLFNDIWYEYHRQAGLL